MSKPSAFRNLPVQLIGAEALRAIAKPVERITPELCQLADEMISAMRKFDGIGLAAPQVGLSLRLVVLEVPPAANGAALTVGEEQLLPRMPLALVNPQIIGRGDKLSEYDEGCLSVPGIFAPVVRPEKVVLQSQLLDGSFITCECGGLLGRCIQHELDHLDGFLFTDRLSPEAASGIAAELQVLKEASRRRHYIREKTK